MNLFSGSEVDLVEERDGKLYGYKFKWNSKKARRKAPPKWLKLSKLYEVITKENLDGFVF